VSHAPLAQLGRGFLSLGVGEVAARVVAFLAAAYISQTVGPANFGIISFALAAMLYAQRVVGWEMDAVGVVEVASEGPDADRAIGSILVFRGVIAAMAMCVVAVVGIWILPETDGRIFIRYAIGLVFVALNARFVYLMRHRAGPAAASRLIAELASAAVIVLLVRGPDDVGKVPLGFIVGEGMAALLLLAGLGGVRLFRSFDRAFALRTTRQASPLVLSSLLGLVVFNLDLIMLRFLRDAESAGYYAAAYALIGLLMNVGIAFYLNLIPGLSRLREDRAAFHALYGSATMLAIMFALPVVMGGTLLAQPLIHTVFGEAFAPAAGPLVPLLFSAGITIVRFVPQALVIASDRRHEVLWINVVGALTSVALNIVLIPRYGIMGAAASTLSTDVLRLSIAVALARRVGGPVDAVWHAWRPLAAALLMGAVVWLIREWPVWYSVPAGALVYGAGLLAFGVIRREPTGRIRFVV
jgi:O-antigen/teichoic acid export membrane protein